MDLTFLILLYLIFAIPALFWLRSRRVEETAQALWALIVLLFPVIGAVALVLLTPGRPLGRPDATDPQKNFEIDEFRRQ